MAQARVSFVPSFVNYSITIGEKKPDSVSTSASTSVSTMKAFNTSRTGKDRVSAPVKIEAMHFDDSTKSIKVFCSDGCLRECRINRLPSVEHGRALWRKLQAFGKAQQEVCFTAAGGFSPDKWFYTATDVSTVE